MRRAVEDHVREGEEAVQSGLNYPPFLVASRAGNAGTVLSKIVLDSPPGSFRPKAVNDNLICRGAVAQPLERPSKSKSGATLLTDVGSNPNLISEATA